MDWKISISIIAKKGNLYELVGEYDSFELRSLEHAKALIDWLCIEEQMDCDTHAELLETLRRSRVLPRKNRPLTAEEIRGYVSALWMLEPGAAEAKLEDWVRLKEISREEADDIRDLLIDTHLLFGVRSASVREAVM